MLNDTKFDTSVILVPPLRALCWQTFTRLAVEELQFDIEKITSIRDVVIRTIM